jgi:hypothetical protein
MLQSPTRQCDSSVVYGGCCDHDPLVQQHKRIIVEWEKMFKKFILLRLPAKNKWSTALSFLLFLPTLIKI